MVVIGYSRKSRSTLAQEEVSNSSLGMAIGEHRRSAWGDEVHGSAGDPDNAVCGLTVDAARPYDGERFDAPQVFRSLIPCSQIEQKPAAERYLA
jgi:hypothetical protein